MGLPEHNPKTIKAVFDVWLSREMVFNNPTGRNLKKYPKYYKSGKIKYTKRILSYLYNMEDAEYDDHPDQGRAVAIKIDGLIRYVWRSDVLIKKEYDEIQKKQRAGFGVLCKKLGRNVGKVSADE